MRISDWSSDVCSSDLTFHLRILLGTRVGSGGPWRGSCGAGAGVVIGVDGAAQRRRLRSNRTPGKVEHRRAAGLLLAGARVGRSLEGLDPCQPQRTEEHTSELQSLMRTSYAVFC